MPPAPTVTPHKITADRLLKFAERANKAKGITQLRAFMALAAREVAGPWFDCDPDRPRTWDQKRPVSSLGEMHRTYMPHLMGEALVPVVDPAGIGGRGESKLLEMRLRRWVDDTRYGRQDEMGINDALLGMGIWYVGRRDGGRGVIDAAGGTTDEGAPFVQRVGVDDFVFDPNADTIDNGTLVGHFYTVDREAMLETGIGNPDELAKCPNVWERDSESGGDGDSTQEGSRGDKSEDDYLTDAIGLWDLCYMHKGRRFCCTVGALQSGAGFIIDPYDMQESGSPEGYPYVTLGLHEMAHRALPCSPAMVMMDAHLGRAAIASKILKEIEELERAYIAEPGSQKTVMKLMSRQYDNPNCKVVFGKAGTLQEMITGGMVKEAIESFGWLSHIGQEIGPSVNLAGGKEGNPGSDPTATEASIKAGAGAVVMGLWTRKVNDARTLVLRRVAAMLMQSAETMEFPVKIPTPMGVMEIPVVWDPASLDLSYDQFRYKIKPTNGLQGMDARARIRSLQETMGMLGQVLPMVLQMGGDPATALRVISDLAAMPELDEMLPTPQAEMLRAQLTQMLAQGGQIKPSGASPAGGPQTRVGQMNSDQSRRVPV